MQVRINETNEQRMRRLTRDRNPNMFTRSIQSDEHRVKRLAHDCEHHSINRESESEDAYKKARENDYTLRNRNGINLLQTKKKWSLGN